MRACYVTRRKSLLLLTVLKPCQCPALRRVRSSLESPCGVWSTSLESTAGGGSWERQKFQDWEERRGFAHLQPAQHKTDLSSQPWNSSSGAQVIKSWTNCDSLLKKIKSSVFPPPPDQARTRFAQELAEKTAVSSASVPALGHGSLLLEAAWHSNPHPALPAEQGMLGEREKVGGTRLSTAEPFHLPTRRAHAYCWVSGSCLILRD